MKIFKQCSILIVITLIVAFAITKVHGKLTMAHFIDTLFMLSLFLFLAGLAVFVAKGGFFDAIVASFKRYWKKTKRFSDVFDESSFYLSETISPELSFVIGGSGLILLALSSAVAFII